MSDITRRRMMGRAAAAAAGIMLAVPATQAFAAESAQTGATSHGEHGDYPGIRPFDEIYQGRRIEGRLTSGHGGHHDFGIEVYIDGRMLHIMPRAWGWVSVMNHYEVFDTPYDTALAAVRALQGANLV
ncbi:tyrosinase family oxidase copper chaperone [Streptomyces sp. NPDC059002]|uniref:apotyrosinase chaperone MelC1 n=1 Tax=Streptomyces sp. NPDC059002 TaxID=3346690 RepID=UPI0036C38501